MAPTHHPSPHTVDPNSKPNCNMDDLLHQFYKQYLQQVTNLTFPPSQLFCHPDIQRQLYRHFFDGSTTLYLPPPDYQRRVLKRLVGEIVKQAVNEDDEVSDDLMAHMGYLSSLPEQGESHMSQSPRVLSYFLPNTPVLASNTSTYLSENDLDKTFSMQRILIRESPRILAAGSNVGLRTWEACLRLAYFLCTSSERATIRGSNVLELGAGTGLLSLICSMGLGASHVVATDGLAHVVSGIENNISLNSQSDMSRSENTNMPLARVLDWTEPSHLDEILKTNGHVHDIDYVLGADITYYQELHDPLASLMSRLKDRFPACRILVSAPLRNEKTLELWMEACRAHHLNVRMMDEEQDKWRCPPYWLQTGLFHEQAFPIVIMDMTK